MSRSCSPVVVALACCFGPFLGGVGCGSEAPVAAAPAPVVSAPPAPKVEPAKVESAKVEPAKVEPRTDGKVGVAACDEYLTVYRGCVAGMDASEQAQHTKVIDQLAASWATAQADPAVAGALPDTCASARAASKVTLPRCKEW